MIVRAPRLASWLALAFSGLGCPAGETRPVEPYAQPAPPEIPRPPDPPPMAPQTIPTLPDGMRPPPRRTRPVADAPGRRLRVLLKLGEENPLGFVSPIPMEVCRIRGLTYVADSGGRLFRLAADGTKTQLPTLGRPMNVACDDDALYYGDERKLIRQPIEGAGTVLAQVEEDPLEIVLDGEYAYFNVYQRRTIYRVSKRGGRAVLLATATRRPAGLAIDDTHVYFADYPAGTIHSVPKAGGAKRTLARGQRHPLAVAVDETWLYFANEDGGSLHRMAKTGGPTTELVRGETNNDIMQVEDGYLYWYSWGSPSSGHTFSRLPLRGGPVEVLIRNLHMPESFLVEGDRLYLVNKGTGELLELTL